MITKEQFIRTEKTARYYISNPEIDILHSVYFVLHGYAQLAKDFINEFDFLKDENTLIVAPEGLSKFYFKNHIGASWMTKEDRLNEINDYTNYLDKIYCELNSRCDLSQSKVNLLGFSQGVHTAVRWFIKSHYHFNTLLLCSSDFPKDAEFNILSEKLKKSKLYFLYGKNDNIISLKTFEDNLNLLKTNNINFEEVPFNGRHEIHKDSLNKIFNK
ncbi:MAG: hypothetical protein IPL53_12815 [Ignavibacteria bacterium]|nr:hypothetical protein [Ignavibacteria bacterium]